MVRHALPNALAPIISVIALDLAYLIVGVVVVETVFVYPGLGQLMVDEVSKHDVPVVQACGLIFAATFILLNMTADILAILSNPRLRRAALNGSASKLASSRGRASERRRRGSFDAAWERSRELTHAVVRIQSQRLAQIGLAIVAINLFVAVFAPLDRAVRSGRHPSATPGRTPTRIIGSGSTISGATSSAA